MTYWVYENWQARPHKAIVHVSSCRFCNDGEGLAGGTALERGRWHGPFATHDQARRTAATLEGVTLRRDCGHCGSS
jgi:F-type H+/Na+-transporting ATPase subunit beta